MFLFVQGTVLNGQPLLIKFPDNPLTQAANHFEKPKRYGAAKCFVVVTFLVTDLVAQDFRPTQLVALPV
jgi:hypothetical protein